MTTETRTSTLATDHQLKVGDRPADGLRIEVYDAFAQAERAWCAAEDQCFGYAYQRFDC
jgi:hypothetical protein